MGTPDEKIWPGVTKLPDFKPVFPRWEPVCPTKILTSTVNDDAKDLFKVNFGHYEFLPSETVSSEEIPNVSIPNLY